MRRGDLVALRGGEAVDQRIGGGEIQCAGDDTGLPQDALDGVGGARAVPQGGVEGVGDVGDQAGRRTASRPTTEVRISSLRQLHKDFQTLEGRRQQGDFIESDVAVTDLGALGDESGGDAVGDAGHAERAGRVQNDRAGGEERASLFERLNEQACYLRTE